MTATGSTQLWYAGFKAAVFALLACNTALYAYSGTLSETVDSVAWLVLLSLFELETGTGWRWRGATAAIRIARLAAAAAVGAATIGYAHEGEWLDVVNTGLWIAVIVLLEFEMRYPEILARRRLWIAATAGTFYAGLAALVLIWAWRGAWFDAYDALLWLTAFAMIEMDVLRIAHPHV